MRAKGLIFCTLSFGGWTRKLSTMHFKDTETRGKNLTRSNSPRPCVHFFALRLFFTKTLMLLFALHLIAAQAHAQNLDIDLLHDLNSGTYPTRDNISLGITHSAVPVFIAVPLGVFIYGAAKHDSTTKRNAYMIAASLATSTIITYGLKYSIKRERPFVSYSFIKQKVEVGPLSFPSGHTSNAFATATSLSLVYPKWYVITPSFLWACSVGYTRMELGVHYPSDVLAGAIVGAGSAWLMWEANKYLRRKKT